MAHSWPKRRLERSVGLFTNQPLLVIADESAWWHAGCVVTPLLRETLTLRVPVKLHRRLRAEAVDNGRSLNAEIVHRLLRSFEDRRPALNRREPS